MEMSKDEVHDIKNQLAIAIGMIELVIRYLSKDPVDKVKITDRLDKSLIAMKKANEFLENKKDNETPSDE